MSEGGPGGRWGSRKGRRKDRQTGIDGAGTLLIIRIVFKGQADYS